MLNKPLWDNVMKEYPYPIAYQAKVTIESEDPRMKFEEALRLSEWIIRYASILSLIRFLDAPKRNMGTVNKLLEMLQQPSMGYWIEIGSLAYKAGEVDNSFWPFDLAKFYSHDLDILVSERNVHYHHGVNPTNDQLTDNTNLILDHLERFLNFEFYTTIFLTCGNVELKGNQLPSMNNLTDGNIYLHSRADKENRSICAHPFFYFRDCCFRMGRAEGTYVPIDFPKPYFMIFQSHITAKRKGYVELAPIESGINYKVFIETSMNKIFSRYLVCSIEIDDLHLWNGHRCKFLISLQNTSDLDLTIRPFELLSSPSLSVSQYTGFQTDTPMKNGEKIVLQGCISYSGERKKSGWLKIGQLEYILHSQTFLIRPGPILNFHCFPAALPKPHLSVENKNQVLDGKKIPVESVSTFTILLDNDGGPLDGVEIEAEINSPGESKVSEKKIWNGNIPPMISKRKIMELSMEPIHTGALAIRVHLKEIGNGSTIASVEWSGEVAREGLPQLTISREPSVSFVDRKEARVFLKQEFEIKNTGSAAAIIRTIDPGKPSGATTITTNDTPIKVQPGELSVITILAEGNIKQSIFWPGTKISFSDYDNENKQELTIPGITVNGWQTIFTDTVVGRSSLIDEAMNYLTGSDAQRAENKLKILWINGGHLVGKNKYVQELINRLRNNLDKPSGSFISSETYDCERERDFQTLLRKMVAAWMKPKAMPSGLWHERFESDCESWIDKATHGDKYVNDTLKNLFMSVDVVLNEATLGRVSQIFLEQRKMTHSIFVVRHFESASKDFMDKFRLLLRSIPSGVKDNFIIVSIPDRRVKGFIDDIRDYVHSIKLVPLSDEIIRELIDELKPFPPFSEYAKEFIVSSSQGIPGITKRYCEILSQPEYSRIFEGQIQLLPNKSNAQLREELDSVNIVATNISFVKTVLGTIREHYSDEFSQTINALLAVVAYIDSDFYLDEIKSVVHEIVPQEVKQKVECRDGIDYLTSLTVTECVSRETHRYRLAGGFNRDALLEVLFHEKSGKRESLNKLLIENYSKKNPLNTGDRRRIDRILVNLLGESSIPEKILFADKLLDIARIFILERDFKALDQTIRILRDVQSSLSPSQRTDMLGLEAEGLLNAGMAMRSEQWNLQVNALIKEIGEIKHHGMFHEQGFGSSHLIARLLYTTGDLDNALQVLRKGRLFLNLFTRFSEKHEVWHDAFNILEFNILIQQTKLKKSGHQIPRHVVNKFGRFLKHMNSTSRRKGTKEWKGLWLDCIETAIELQDEASAKQAMDDFSRQYAESLNTGEEIRFGFLKAKIWEKDFEKHGKTSDKKVDDAINFAEQYSDMHLLVQSQYLKGLQLQSKKEYESAVEYFEQAKSNLPAGEYQSLYPQIIKSLSSCYYIISRGGSSDSTAKNESARKAIAYREEHLNILNNISPTGMNADDKAVMFEQLGDLYGIIGDRQNELSMKIKSGEVGTKEYHKKLRLRSKFELGNYFLYKKENQLAIKYFQDVMDGLDGDDKRYCSLRLAKAFFHNMENIPAVKAYNEYVRRFLSLPLSEKRKTVAVSKIFGQLIEMWDREPNNQKLLLDTIGIMECIVFLAEPSRRSVFDNIIGKLRVRGLEFHVFLADTILAEAFLKQGMKDGALTIFEADYDKLLLYYDTCVRNKSLLYLDARNLVLRILEHLVFLSVTSEEWEARYRNLLSTSIALSDYYTLAMSYKISGEYYCRIKNDLDEAGKQFSKCLRVLKLQWQSDSDVLNFTKNLAISLLEASKEEEAWNLLVNCLEISMTTKRSSQISEFYSLLSDLHYRRGFMNISGSRKASWEYKSQTVLATALDFFLNSIAHPETFHILYTTTKHLSKFSYSDQISFDIHRYLYQMDYEIKNQFHDIGLNFLYQGEPYLGIGLLEASFELELTYYWPRRQIANPVVYYNSLLTASNLVDGYLKMNDYIRAMNIVIDHLIPKLDEALVTLRDHVATYGTNIDQFPLIHIVSTVWNTLSNLRRCFADRYGIPDVVENDFQFSIRKDNVVVYLDHFIGRMRHLQELAACYRKLEVTHMQLLQADYAVAQKNSRLIHESFSEWRLQYPIIPGLWLKYIGLERKMMRESQISISPEVALNSLFNRWREAVKKEDEYSQIECKNIFNLLNERLNFNEIISRWQLTSILATEREISTIKIPHPVSIAEKMAMLASEMKNPELAVQWCTNGLEVVSRNQSLQKLINDIQKQPHPLVNQ